MLKVLAKLLETLGEFLGTEEEIWLHGSIYLIVAEYYSRKKINASPLYLKTQPDNLGKSQAQTIKFFNSLNAS